MRFIYLLACLMLSVIAYPQVLFKLQQLSGPGNDYISAMATDSKGNTYLAFSLGWSTGTGNEIYNVLGNTQSSGSVPNLIKLDKSGAIVWTKSFGGLIEAIAFDKDDNPYVASSPSYSFNVSKLTPDGDILWQKTEGSSGGFWGLDILTDKDGNCYVTGTVSSWNAFGLDLATTSCCRDHDFLVKYDSNGQQLWAIGSDADDNTNGKALAFDPDGSIVLAGQFMYSMTLGGFSLANNIGYENLYLARISTNGNVLSLKGFGGAGGHTAVTDMSIDSDGSVYLTGGFSGTTVFDSKSYQSQGDYDFFLTKLDPQDNVLWFRNHGRIGVDQGESLIISGNDLYVGGVFSGNVTLDNAQIGYIIGPTTFISKFDKSNGKASWIKGYGTLSHQSYSLHGAPIRLAEIESRYLRVFGAFDGQMTGYDNTFESRARDLYVGEVLDTLFTQPGAALRGRISVTNDGSCGGVQQPLQNVIVKAEPGPFFGVTNSAGEFQLRLPEGSYSVGQILPQKRGLAITPVCPETNPNITIASVNDVLPSLNFVNAVEKKPYLTTDVAGVFRRCFQNDFSVQYCNEGQAPASNVEIVVTFPEHVIPLSSSIPWTSKTDNKLTYNFTALEAGECGRISIRDSVICGNESIRGLTQCVTATISPPNSTTPDPAWDRSDIELSGTCLDNGFVRLGLRNSGIGHMKDSATFLIYVDASLVFDHKYKLSSGDSLILQVPANGKTIRLEALATANSPRAMVTITLEGCGGAEVSTISKGFVNALDQGDDEEEVESFCGIILDSFDPNDKQVIPAGITAEHRINGTEELEYFIRFQNTGNAPAHTVVVRDVLDPALDLSTLQPAMASHSFSFKVEGSGKPELVWRFTNIMLPDSTTDEPGSHGFIKFKIKPLPGLERNTVIKNSAAIYFDFNSPVITNEVFNTIGMPAREPGQHLVVQNCAENISVDAGEDRHLNICDDTSVLIDDPLESTAGYGQWHVFSGGATVQSAGEKLEIGQLSEGTNTLRYLVTHCDNADSSVLEIQRTLTPLKPSIIDNATFCSAQIGQFTLHATGNDLSWYADELLTEKISDQNEFYPAASQMLFVTDKTEDCESEASRVTVQMVSTPEPPSPLAFEACQNVMTTLKAAGPTVLWYENTEAEKPVAGGNTFNTKFATPGIHQFFITQVVNGCESDKRIVEINVRQYERDNVFISNVITPNEDGFNDEFFFKEQEFSSCLGNFKHVRIYNRFGQTLFTSNQSDFKWNGKGVDTGVYFYALTFEHDAFMGTISIFR